MQGRRSPDSFDLKKNPLKEGTLGRRRKVSVPDICPMTTVQETHLDSRKEPIPHDSAALAKKEFYP
jgi:hypothetical protein